MNTPEWQERENQLERIVGEMTDKQLFSFALWDMYSNTESSSDAVCCELLRRSGISESLAKY